MTKGRFGEQNYDILMKNKALSNSDLVGEVKILRNFADSVCKIDSGTKFTRFSTAKKRGTLQAIT